ncbi:hypothetical protein GLOTRDRAFT_33719 [Gloeophyllum trabeum ATCC 11539]|uniref:DUF6593 domain-containing protein n=1 Tax=Gloeophyllum trabeum (strain ATCC 11539 / FP-39264 / Madison 617) TaxID=670483 RepID=S7S231_GLOTA|nr:uncharacterized protein GLOTRDRAFT_33719 [Gloeophyllum trabeum ATCC 11539]EPQ59839.1 hypothetical protein GLOTRDRAFT_33719 [Gloeophyllum trabeum ATCC 11539]
MSTTKGLPYILEDRTGSLTATDFDDIYDRLFLRVAHTPQGLPAVYDMGRRSASSRADDRRHFRYTPSVVMHFGDGSGALGSVAFVDPPASLPMGKYLRRASFLGGSLSRKFKASDGQEYKWSYRIVEGQEWTCTSADNVLVAHYNLRPPRKPAYGSSGNILTIYDEYAHLALEIVASLTIMRYIKKHNL